MGASEELQRSQMDCSLLSEWSVVGDKDLTEHVGQGKTWNSSEKLVSS